MKTPTPQAPPTALFVTDGTENTSPVARLANTPDGDSWLVELKAAYEAEKSDGSYKYHPHQSPDFTEMFALELLIKALETKKDVFIRDICLKVYNGMKSNGAFEELCGRLFPEKDEAGPKLIGNSPNFVLWEKVFTQVKVESEEKIDLTATTIVISDQGYGDNSEAHIFGIFEQDRKRISIDFEYLPTWDTIEKINFS